MPAYDHWTSAELLARFCRGEESAADQLFERYSQRLILLARARLSARLACKMDAEDVAMSAWRSFFIGARQEHFTLTAPGDLWRLLVSITLHKLYHQARHHAAGRRSITREKPLDQTPENLLPTSTTEPTVHEALALAEELEAVMANLDAEGRRVLELRLQGEQIAAIGQLTNRSERTVRRILDHIRKLVAARFGTELLTERRQVDTDEPAAATKAPPRESRTDPILVREGEFARLDSRDYLLQRMLGAGRFGKVYRARQRSIHQYVAIKYLRKGYLESPEVIARFLEEAQTLALLHHPGIVKFHGLGTTAAGHYFIVMDWIDGPNLAEVLHSSGPVAPSQAIQWMLQISDALEHAHERGILHCDLKPSNLLLDSDDRVFITDFGLARSLADKAEMSGRIEGTPAFMAPEQVTEWWGPVCRQTDIYGLGAVLFALLTGQPPWPEKRLADVLARILTSEPVVAVERLRPDIPKPISEICRRCLAKSPDERFATMSELRLALLDTAI